MGARRLREPVVQMRETLVVVKTVADLQRREEAIRGLMLARGMKPTDATKRLGRAMALAEGHEPAWPFALAWAVAWETIYWPHLKNARAFEEECLAYARREFAKAYDGLPTKLEHLRGMLEALEEVRDEQHRAAAGVVLVA